MVLCERCENKEATVTISRITNEKKHKIHLCSDCAAEEGYFAWSFEPQFPVHSLLKSLLNDMSGKAASQRLTPGRTVSSDCPNCGRSYSDFSRTGFLGCGQCYETFSDTIKPLLRRIQGGTVHRGSRPGEQSEAARSDIRQQMSDTKHRIKKLKRQLKEAVDMEEYERAAELRDMIAQLEGEDHE